MITSCPFNAAGTRAVYENETGAPSRAPPNLQRVVSVAVRVVRAVVEAIRHAVVVAVAVDPVGHAVAIAVAVSTPAPVVIGVALTVPPPSPHHPASVVLFPTARMPVVARAL